MMIKPLIALLATSALAVKLVRHLSDRHQLRRAHDERRRQREDVYRWEEEGGNLPTRSQVPR
ncbi:hypothetical protein LXT12_06630 [Pelomonas sp. P7]|uniref:Uncharacterized protein n=1 Tax=Pelomonas caseinilytica TaxID=2906763 RepID=A0ABS8XD54_9BURK|nr:hypothetical protein [Pelomonas sp. P7]MCE4536922.1 hypothetical protein [Pelomonas sp. P7]